MKFPHKRLLLAAALGLPVMLTGCHSRAELLTSTAVDSPTRTVAAEADSVDPSQSEANSEPADDAVTAQTASDRDTSATTPSTEPSARSILEAAGAVIEFDEQERAVGIDLTEARMTPDVTRSIANLSDLQWIDLRGTRLTDADLAIICALPQFELMALGKTRITDAGLTHLRQQQKLRFLSLDGTAVTDAGLPVLAGLPRLEGLSLANTSISKSAASDFENRQPGCRVILDEDAPDSLPQEQPTSAPLDEIDWAQPAAEPQPPANGPDQADQPAPGEPISGIPQEETWFLDETESTVSAQPLSQDLAPVPDVQIATTPTGATPFALPQAASRQLMPEEQVDVAQPIEISPEGSTLEDRDRLPSATSSTEDTAQRLHQILQQRLRDPEVLTALSQHLLAQHEYAKAARALEALAALTPDDPQVRFDLGAALARSGAYDRAHPELASVVGDATAWYNLGVIAYERNEPQHSERFFSRAIDLTPDFREARAWLNKVRETSTAANATAHPSPAAEGQDLVDLLMSEFGSGGTPVPARASAAPAPTRSAAGILIVPAN